jgi:type IV pilus secretin PilQ/predicted competence protein
MVKVGSMKRAKRIVLIASVLAVSVNAASASLWKHRNANKPATPAAAPSGMTLTAIEVDSSSSQLVLRTSGAPAFTSLSPAPDQFVVDLNDTTKVPSLVIPSNLPAGIIAITADEITDMGSRLTRVSIRLAKPMSLQAAATGNMVTIALPMVAEKKEEPKPVEAPLTVAVIPAQQTDMLAETIKPATEPAVSAASLNLPKARTLKKVETSGAPSALEVQLDADGEIHYKTFKLQNPSRIVIDLNGIRARLAKKTIEVNDPVVKRVRVAQFTPDVTRVVLDVDGKPDYKIVASGDHLRIAFGDAAAKMAAAPPMEIVPPPPAPVKKAEATPKTEPAKTDIPSQVPTIADNSTWKMPADATAIIHAQETQTPPAPAPRTNTTRRTISGTAPATVPSAPTTNENVFSEPQARTPALGGALGGPSRVLTPGERVYTGEPISLNLKDADIKDVLRTFAELTGLNIAVDPGVAGSVTVDFVDVPWDQALDIILRQNGLSYVLEGNVMRVGTLARLSEEATANRRLQEEERLNVPLTTVSFKLSYARATDVQNLLKDIASPRARIIVDQRTNQLIISEIPAYLQTMRNLIESVDVPTRQVVIEARIVETTKTFLQQYGFVWGFRGALDPSLGTGTGLVFPNRVDFVGGPFDFGPGNSVLSFHLANVLGTFNLDVALNAAESEGLVRVISAPRVQTQDNTPAQIQSGLQIPFQTRVNFTTTISYVDATLQLSVTPQITEAGTVIMEIAVQKNEPATGLAIEGAAGTPIQTRQARTRLMVRDGGTSVIGGIYQTTDNNSQTRLPFLWQIPVLGNLFKTHNIQSRHDELLIFITPRIVRTS